VYSAVLAGSFEESGMVMVPYNFGVDGQDSTQLAAYIVNNPAIPEALADADYVSISIGANNFLGEAFDFLNVCYDFQKNPSTRLTSDDVTLAYQQFNRDVADGVERLRDDIPQIIEGIRAANEDCDILFLTCYNPYGAVDVTLDWGGVMPVNFAALAATSVTQMNDVIRDLADDYDYHVADVYSAFEGKWDRLVNAAPVESGGSLNMNAVDPHPNKNGHAVIADVLMELIYK
jgi:lysophospholipase L1-like esterase